MRPGEAQRGFATLARDCRGGNLRRCAPLCRRAIGSALPEGSGQQNPIGPFEPHKRSTPHEASCKSAQSADLISKNGVMAGLYRASFHGDSNPQNIFPMIADQVFYVPGRRSFHAGFWAWRRGRRGRATLMKSRGCAAQTDIPATMSGQMYDR